ncbi:tyrosine-type recombinase/integrase, partial [Flavonifractor plautii]|uniref:tyrosine-type recombinase/integrase n=1 Tax=Flavonifractor plautii TaxID=292800 RepID=UPI0023315455
RMPPLPADSIHARACKLKCEKILTRPSFRHRFAKSFLDRCNDIAFLADLMGHESIETTRIYLRKTATEQREIVDTIIDW